MSTSASTLKARHYAALSNSLRHLQQDLSESEIQMVRLADHLESMQKMGTYSAAQFMAVSRLLDKELNDEEEKRLAEEAAEAEAESRR